MSKELMITSFIPTKEKISFKGFVKRTVTTAFGHVTFERRKYVDKKTGVCYYILFGRYYYRSRKRGKYSIFKRRRKIDKGSSEGNITKQNDLKKTAKNILLCYFGCPYIFYSVNFLEKLVIHKISRYNKVKR